MKRRRGRWKRKKRRKKGKTRKKNKEGEKEEEEEEKVKEEGFGIFSHAARRCLAHEKLNCIYLSLLAICLLPPAKASTLLDLLNVPGLRGGGANDWLRGCVHFPPTP